MSCRYEKSTCCVPWSRTRVVGSIPHPFRIHGWVALSDHLHFMIEFPEGDVDFSVRWRSMEMGFSKSMPATGRRPAVRQRAVNAASGNAGSREHLIRDEDDSQAHMDHVHFNPAKHGLVTRVVDWPYSTFRRLVEQGVHPTDWGGGVESNRLVYDDRGSLSLGHSCGAMPFGYCALPEPGLRGHLARAS